VKAAGSVEKSWTTQPTTLSQIAEDVNPQQTAVTASEIAT
jgi:hypothetical protein